MRLLSLRLHQFRNYREMELPLIHDITIFYGDNAQGKTNLLEGIYTAARGFSFRTRRDEELALFGTDAWAAQLGYEDQYGSHTLLVKRAPSQGREKKKTVWDGNKISTRQQYGRLNLVLFTPDDLWLVKGEPVLRRRFLDMEIAQTSPTYYELLSRYNRVLQQRNSFLKHWQKDGKAAEPQLVVWDQALVEPAAGILDLRLRALTGISAAARDVYARITGNNGELTLSYQQKKASATSVVEENPGRSYWVQLLLEELQKRHALDLLRGYTSVGPHRDDLDILHNGRSLKAYGSQGQQRTAALSLKLSELEFIRKIRGEYPILLLDDVLSELDQHRREKLLQCINGTVQTFLTVNDRHLAPTAGDVVLYQVRSGQLEETAV